MLIERATGQSFIQYFETKIWYKINTTQNAQWILDGHKHKMPKAYMELVVTANDIVKIGNVFYIDSFNILYKIYL